MNAIKQTYSHSIKQDDNESSSDMNSRSTSISDTSSSVQLDGGFLAYTLIKKMIIIMTMITIIINNQVHLVEIQQVNLVD